MKQHAIYGDDDLEKLSKLFDQEDEIQKLVEISNRQLMKERYKNISKKKKIDTTVNAEKPKEIPQDITEGKPDTKKKKVEEKPKKEKKKKEKKETDPNAIRKVIIIILLIVVLGILFTFKNEIGSGINSLISSFKSRETSSENTEVATDSTNIADVILLGKTANETLRNDYNDLIEITETSKSEFIASKIAEYYDDVVAEREKFETYQTTFEQFANGTKYYNTLYNRFTTLENLLMNIQKVDSNDVYAYVNVAVDNENKNIDEDRNALISFLEANNIEYTEDGNDIITVLD